MALKKNALVARPRAPASMPVSATSSGVMTAVMVRNMEASR